MKLIGKITGTLNFFETSGCSFRFCSEINQLKMNKILIFAVLCVASTIAFELPMVVDIGGFDPNAMLRINHEVQAVGPFTQPRNHTFHFEWESGHYTIHGVRIRGSEPRYDLVSVQVHRLERKFFSISVTVTNTSFALFWCEPHGYEDFIPGKVEEEAEAKTN